MTINYKAIGKLSGLDTNVVKSVMSSIIMYIGETLSKEENILIDLGRFGRLHGIM